LPFSINYLDNTIHCTTFPKSTQILFYSI